ncbi:hypothetical protein TanjilG_14825 [Lupinus angustifolius]|uniref:DUF7755 domain-containing protein n=2 Tax=Lupinus angustifolius TaxID=3871 RepID=A0A1J7GJE0_LUPAN|nr:PREDICTED: uncharacterized protein LOC109362694 [Lupinus angustifolius]OIW00599.1 hypothetical protein TanjilG_14825 [Lupinus angustifolius]
MEVIPVRSIIPSISMGMGHVYTRNMRIHKITSSPIHPTKTLKCPLRFAIRAKQSSTDFQDFQSYVRPSRLLPSSEVKVYTNTSLENISSFLKEDRSKSLFRVKLGTSNIYGSSISDNSAGILLCLIDENGNSILQRIPASSMMDHSTESGDITHVEMLHFQRGSVDEFIFEGPKIARVDALWIGIESGQWRIGHVSLMVINCEVQPSEDGELQYTGYQYHFLIDNVLLGEGSDLSMLELRHSHVSELEQIDPVSFFDKGLDNSTLFSSPKISNEESMREYADLKFSLLFYDVMLIFFGTSVTSFLAGGNTGFAFLIGGIGGFVYLLLLQRSVDALPASELITGNKGGALFGGLKEPIASVALAVGFAVFVVRYSSGDLQVTPNDLIFGMMGFLACKISVVLAAFKPIKAGLRLPTDM